MHRSTSAIAGKELSINLRASAKSAYQSWKDQNADFADFRSYTKKRTQIDP
jgi:hypothetical protein